MRPLLKGRGHIVARGFLFLKAPVAEEESLHRLAAVPLPLTREAFAFIRRQVQEVYR